MSLEDKYLASGKNTKAAAYPGQSIQTKDHSIYNIILSCILQLQDPMDS